MRLIDADADKCRPYLYEYLTDAGMIAAQDAINAMPSIDAVPVVRCKDCKYDQHCLTQEFVMEGSIIPFDRNTFFCSDGTKEDADERTR